jgi:hypothetical protein
MYKFLSLLLIFACLSSGSQANSPSGAPVSLESTLSDTSTSKRLRAVPISTPLKTSSSSSSSASSLKHSLLNIPSPVTEHIMSFTDIIIMTKVCRHFHMISISHPQQTWINVSWNFPSLAELKTGMAHRIFHMNIPLSSGQLDKALYEMEHLRSLDLLPSEASPLQNTELSYLTRLTSLHTLAFLTLRGYRGYAVERTLHKGITTVSAMLRLSTLTSISLPRATHITDLSLLGTLTHLRSLDLIPFSKKFR